MKNAKKNGRFTPQQIQLFACIAGLIVVAAALLIPRLMAPNPADAQLDVPSVTVEPTEIPSIDEPEPTATPPLVPSEPLPLLEIAQNESVSSKKLNLRHAAVAAGQKADPYTRSQPIAMGAPDDYAELPGVTTFRGNNMRDNSAYGTVPTGASKLEPVWSVNVGGIDDWNGVGWTGQAAIVEWPEDVRNQMNIAPEKRSKDGLREVIIAALDGKIRFIDLDDGKPTRKSIDIGAPIKGSVTVDPRGYPILYCGQGIFEVGGKTVKCGTRIISLIDHKLLFFLNGEDKYRTRNWYCFDAAPLVDAATDTMFQIGENGLVYSLQLNTNYDRERGTISMNPVVDRWGYKSNVTTRPGMENSIAVYNHYGFFVDNSGLFICLDLNTFQPMWAADVGDDTDATTAIEQDADGLWLYTANEMDLRGDAGNIQMRCVDALTGTQRWKGEVHVSNRELSGAFASPAIGKQGLSDIVYFHISKTRDGGTLYALDKATGDPVWTQSMGTYGWSTPSLLYDETGRGYVLIGSSNGRLRLIDGLSGNLITSIDLGNNIEGSPAVYDDMAVVSTRGGKVIGVKIS